MLSSGLSSASVLDPLPLFHTGLHGPYKHREFARSRVCSPVPSICKRGRLLIGPALLVGDLTVRTVETEEVFQVHVADAVAVRKHERAVPQPRLQPLHAPPGVGALASVAQVYGPIGVFSLVGLNLPLREVDGQAS